MYVRECVYERESVCELSRNRTQVQLRVSCALLVLLKIDLFFFKLLKNNDQLKTAKSVRLQIFFLPSKQY